MCRWCRPTLAGLGCPRSRARSRRAHAHREGNARTAPREGSRSLSNSRHESGEGCTSHCVCASPEGEKQRQVRDDCGVARATPHHAGSYWGPHRHEGRGRIAPFGGWGDVQFHHLARGEGETRAPSVCVLIDEHPAGLASTPWRGVPSRRRTATCHVASAHHPSRQAAGGSHLGRQWPVCARPKWPRAGLMGESPKRPVEALRATARCATFRPPMPVTACDADNVRTSDRRLPTRPRGALHGDPPTVRRHGRDPRRERKRRTLTR